MEWLTAKNSHSNGPQPFALPLAHLQRVRRDPVLAQLGLDHRQRQSGPQEGDVRSHPQQERHRPDVVLVAVREDDRLDVGQSVGDVARSPGRTRSTPGWDSSGTAPRSRRSAAGHRSPGRPCCARSRRSRRGRRSEGSRLAQALPAPASRGDRPHASNPATPAAARSARRVATCVGGGVDQREAHRPGGQPEPAQRRLGHDHSLGAEHAHVGRDHRRVQLGGAATSPARWAAIISAIRSLRTCPTTETTPTARRRAAAG